MAMTDLSLLSALRTRMQWHQERQRILAENVSNADTPHFRPKDLSPLRFQPATNGPSASGPAGGVTLARTDAAHLGAGDGSASFGGGRKSGYEVRPSGNAVNLEDEMIKVAANQMDYQAATSLYSRSLGLLKTAIGKR
jgi:flagellar basal-body rod protein FlgB